MIKELSEPLDQIIAILVWVLLTFWGHCFMSEKPGVSTQAKWLAYLHLHLHMTCTNGNYDARSDLFTEKFYEILCLKFQSFVYKHREKSQKFIQSLTISFFVTNSNMSKTCKAILVSIYCAVFLHSLKYLLFHRNEEIIQLNYLLRTPGLMHKLRRDIIKYRNNTTKMTMDFKQPIRFPTDLKFILIWNEVYNHPNRVMRDGQEVFHHHNCTNFNCFITSNKDYLIDLRYFDVLLFDEENELDYHPPLRAPNQKYVFTASETAKFYPVCKAMNENYFNMTWTYRLDSDIPKPFITILDKNGLEVGPKMDMTWVTPMKPVTKDVLENIRKKHIAVAWFKSYCASKKGDKTEEFVRRLNISLMKHKLKLDIFGWCGNKKCPRGRIEECLSLLRKDYYFYLAFESSVSEDYVTDTILYPLQNYAVPIVYGGANYSRFLPPGSYIDAEELGVDKVVALIIESITNKDVYSEYFKWRNHYTYKQAPPDIGVCALCEVLNDPQHSATTVKNFRKWWNRQYHSKCGSPIERDVN